MAARQKSANFSELEKEILLELIHAKKDIIENKQNDGRMVSKKNTEWTNIEKEFNSRHGVNKRTITQLKSLWKNLKARTNSRKSDCRAYFPAILQPHLSALNHCHRLLAH